jgi:hypothetical protein
MRTLTLLPILVLTPFTGADILVPTDQPDLQAAILAASPGETILVQTADNQHVGPWVTVDKPLTILGDPICNIHLGFSGGGLSLAGPGSGNLTLGNVSMEYLFQDNDGLPFVFGGGFDSVQFLGCSIRHNNTMPSGLITHVFPAVDLSAVPLVTVIDSELVGGPAGNDSCLPSGSVLRNGEPGLRAALAQVFAVNSTIRGGQGCTFGQEVSAPCDLAAWNGKGGAGIVSAQVHAWDSLVVGGAGCAFASYPSGFCGFGTPVSCGSQSDGQPIVATGTVVQAKSRLQASAALIPLGSSWSLSWDATSPGLSPDLSGCGGTCLGYLYLAFSNPVTPLPFGSGFVYLKPSGASVLAVFQPAASAQLTYPVPADPILLGLPVMTQALLGSGDLSGATFGLLVP